MLTATVCSRPDCDGLHHAKGLCGKHYKQEYYRDPENRRRQTENQSRRRCQPELREQELAAQRERRRDPKVRARLEEYGREYRQRPEVKARTIERLRVYEKEYLKRPGQRAKKNAYNLARYHRLGGRGYQRHRMELWHAQGGKCALCARPMLAIGSDSHVDHMKPVVHGGTDAHENLQLLCPPCNLAKATKERA